jgi:hypothetical protein
MTLLGAAMRPSGIHIVGKAGVNECLWISNDETRGLWEKARKFDSPESAADFMSQWGQISRSLLDDGTRPYDEAYILIEEHLAGLKHLATFVDAYDRIGFCSSLNQQVLLHRANIVIDVSQADHQLVIEAPSLLRFMLLEMWSEFGGERPAHVGIRNCAHCRRMFHVGGRRGTKTRRQDAKYCSESCKNMASRARRAEDPVTRQP